MNTQQQLNEYKKEWNELPRTKNLKGEKAMKAVKQDGHALRYVVEQTPEICLEAVRQNGYALQYVAKQTPEICLEAVKQKGEALQYVSEQTPEICLEAVKQNGYALRYVAEHMFTDISEDVLIINGVRYRKEQ